MRKPIGMIGTTEKLMGILTRGSKVDKTFSEALLCNKREFHVIGSGGEKMLNVDRVNGRNVVAGHQFLQYSSTPVETMISKGERGEWVLAV